MTPKASGCHPKSPSEGCDGQRSERDEDWLPIGKCVFDLEKDERRYVLLGAMLLLGGFVLITYVYVTRGC
jgi:hypothetical protein